jgi:hypothetical protein
MYNTFQTVQNQVILAKTLKLETFFLLIQEIIVLLNQYLSLKENENAYKIFSSSNNWAHLQKLVSNGRNYQSRRSKLKREKISQEYYFPKKNSPAKQESALNKSSSSKLSQTLQSTKDKKGSF